MNPLVSIGAVFYNDEKTVRSTIESILSQRYDNLEIILSDDCSTDGTAAICRQYAAKDQRIRFFTHKRNLGALANHEFAYHVSNGDYFMWITGHDAIDSIYVASCVQSLETDPSLALCYGKVLKTDIHGNREALLYEGLDTRGMDVVQAFQAVFATLITNAHLFYGVFRGDVLKKSGLHRRTMGGDLIFISEIALLGHILQKEDTTFHRRAARPPATHLESSERWLNNIIQPKGYRLEALTPWLNMGYEYISMIANSSRPLAERQRLIPLAIELLKRVFGNLITAEIDGLLNLDLDKLTDQYSRSYCLSEIIHNLARAKFFYPDPGRVEEALHAYVDSTCRPLPVNAPAPSSVTAAAFASPQATGGPFARLAGREIVRLYAGDVPPLAEYEGWFGLSLKKDDDRHIPHDITNPMPLPDNSVDAYQAEDVLEHIQYDRLPQVVNEIYRVLKPGALFRLSVPDYGCDVLRARVVRDGAGNMVFDPEGGGTPEDPGHLWFPRIESVYRMLEKTRFHRDGAIRFLHYWNMDDKSYVTLPIDYSKGVVRRTPDFDDRVKRPYRPMSIVADLIKQ